MVEKFISEAKKEKYIGINIDILGRVSNGAFVRELKTNY